MARVVDTLVSVSGYLALRYSFGISGLLRSRGVPGILVFSPLLWPLCPGRPAMRRCVDVDLRYRRLLDRRGSLHRAFTLAESIDGSAQDGGDLKMSQRSALTELFSADVQPRQFGESTLLSDYWALTKPEVNFL